MLSLIIQITIVSIIFIFVIHYLINFFKDNLTVPKIKDLVNAPSKKYEDMYNVISSSASSSSSSYNEYDLLPSSTIIPTPPPESMKNELKNFLKKQLSTTDISSLPSSSSLSSSSSSSSSPYDSSYDSTFL